MWGVGENIIELIKFACLLSHFNLVWLFVILWTVAPEEPRLLCPWDSPGKNTGVGCHLLLQGFFLTQESKLHLLRLLHWQVNSLLIALPGIKFRQRPLFNVSWMNWHSLSKFYFVFGQKLTHFPKIPLEMQGSQNSWENLEKWTTLDKSFLISRFTTSHKAIHKKLLA